MVYGETYLGDGLRELERDAIDATAEDALRDRDDCPVCGEVWYTPDGDRTELRQAHVINCADLRREVSRG